MANNPSNTTIHRNTRSQGALVQKQEEANTLTLANTPAANLDYWHQAHNMAFPISGDILAITREAHAIQEPELAAQIVQARTSEWTGK